MALNQPLRRGTLAIITGLGQDPAGPCLGLRAIAEDLANRFPLDLVFASYKSCDDEIDALLAPFDQPNQPLILTGHSLGGGQAHATALRRVDRRQRVDALGIWEPVPESEAFNGAYRFDPVADVRNQICIRIAGDFPLSWGRRFSDESLNLNLPRQSWGLFAIDHAAICTRPEIAGWYRETVSALCLFEESEIATATPRSY